MWILIGLLVFSPLLEGGATHLAAMIIRLMLLLLAGLYMAVAIKRGVAAVPVFRIGPVVAAFLGLAVVSTVTSLYLNQSLQWLTVLIGYAVLLYLLAGMLTSWSAVATLLGVATVMGLLESGWALVQALWFHEQRPNGTFFNPNFLAGYLAVIWTIVLACLCYGRYRSGRREETRPWLLVPASTAGVLAFLLLVIVWTGSRGGALALLAGAALVLGMRFGRKGVMVLVIVALVGLFTPNPLSERLKAQHQEGSSISFARWQMWQYAVREMADHPFGVGLGLYQYLYPRYAFPLEGQIARYGKVAQTPHNEYLQVGVELGWGGLLLFLGGLAVVAREAVLLLRQRLRRWQRGLLVGVIAGIAGILVQAAVDSNLHEPAIAILLTCCVGIVLAAGRLVERHPAPARVVSIKPRWLWAGLGTVLVVSLATHVVRLGVAWVFHESGSQALAKRELPQAIADFQTAVRLDEGKTLYRSSLAAAHFRTFERTGDPLAAEAAVNELRTAVALNPTDGRLQGLLGYVYASLAAARESPASSEQRLVWTRAAIASYERAAEREPFAAFHGLELGRLYLALGERETAETWVRRAVELEPNFLPGREWLAQRWMESGRLEEAERECREILERQQRYAAVSKDELEQRFLAVDVGALVHALDLVRERG